MWERVGKTFIQGFASGIAVGRLVDAISTKNIPVLALLVLGGVGGGTAAVVSLIKNALLKPPSHPGPWGIVERAVWTFGYGALAALPTQALAASIAKADVSALTTLGLSALGAGIAALLSVGTNMSLTALPASVHKPHIQSIAIRHRKAAPK